MSVVQNIKKLNLTKRKAMAGFYGTLAILMVGLFLPYSLLLTVETQTTIPKVSLEVDGVVLSMDQEDNPYSVLIRFDLSNPSTFLDLKFNHLQIYGVYVDGEDLGATFRMMKFYSQKIEPGETRTYELIYYVGEEKKLDQQLSSLDPTNAQWAVVMKYYITVGYQSTGKTPDMPYYNGVTVERT